MVLLIASQKTNVMKKLMLFTFLLVSMFAKAQERSSIAVSYGIGNGQIGSFGKSGYASNKSKSLNIFGVNYWHEISRNLYFETGLQLFRHNYIYTIHGGSSPPENLTMKLFSAPFKLRFEAGDYIFFNGGLTVDLSKGKKNNIGGIGAGIGAGIQVKTYKNLSLYVNPQANIHGILSGGLLFAESHFLFGLAYRIPSKK